MRSVISIVVRLFAISMFALAATGALAQTDDCKNRGQLDTLYCDENKDLVADPPRDPKRWKNPSTLVFTYTPVEDAAVYETAFKPFLDYLGKCTGKRVVYFPGAVERGRDRSHARRPASRRRVLDRPDGIRGESRRRGAVRDQGHREGAAGLQPDHDRQEVEPVPEALGPEG